MTKLGTIGRVLWQVGWAEQDDYWFFKCEDGTRHNMVIDVGTFEREGITFFRVFLGPLSIVVGDLLQERGTPR